MYGAIPADLCALIEPVVEDHGFELVDHDTRMKDFFDAEELKSVYYPECEQLVKERSGAYRVVIFDQMLHNPDLLLINSPRSAVTLLRTGTDLHQLVNQVAAAHTVNPLEARQSATSKQRVSGDRDHQLLAKQRRRQLEVQHEVHEKLTYLKKVYDDICLASSLQDIYDIRDAEHKKRLVIVKKPVSRVVDRSTSILFKKSELNDTVLSNKESSAERTRIRTEEAGKRRRELLDNRVKLEAQRSMRRGEIQHSQMRSKIFNDIEAREAAALQCQRVYNFEKRVI